MGRTLRLPGWLTATAITSIGGFLNGYDTGSIGAITTMPAFEATMGPISSSIQGFTVSLIMLMGAVPAFYAGQLADRYGHLRVVLAGAFLFAIGAIMEAAASQLPVLLVGRALAGLGQGIWLSNVSVYITEIAPAQKRGMLVAAPTTMAALGIVAGYMTCYGSIHIDSSLAWRLPFIIMVVLSIAFAIGSFCLPTSPRWLFAKGRHQDAMAALEWLGISRTEIEKDMLSRQQSQETAPSLKRVWHIFNKQYRLRTMLGFFILGMVQLSGIDGVLYYAPILFAQAGLPAGQASFLASGVSGILALAISIPAFYFADAWSRRACTITGGVGLSTCMFVIGSLYASDSVHKTGVGRWVVIVLIFAFAVTYVATWAIVGKIYASEIQPVETRATANSLAQGLNFFANFLVALITPIFLSHSSYGAYFLFGSFSFTTLLVLVFYMPETRGKSLEAIQDSFKAPNAIRLGRRVLDGGISRVNASRAIDLEDVRMSGGVVADVHGGNGDVESMASTHHAVPAAVLTTI